MASGGGLGLQCLQCTAAGRASPRRARWLATSRRERGVEFFFSYIWSQLQLHPGTISFSGPGCSRGFSPVCRSLVGNRDYCGFITGTKHFAVVTRVLYVRRTGAFRWIVSLYNLVTGPEQLEAGHQLFVFCVHAASTKQRCHGEVLDWTTCSMKDTWRVMNSGWTLSMVRCSRMLAFFFCSQSHYIYALSRWCSLLFLENISKRKASIFNILKYHFPDFFKSNSTFQINQFNILFVMWKGISKMLEQYIHNIEIVYLICWFFK